MGGTLCMHVIYVKTPIPVMYRNPPILDISKVGLEMCTTFIHLDKSSAHPDTYF